MSLKVDEEIKRLADILDLPSESEAEQNRLKAGYRARAEELKALRQQIKQENEREGGSWSFGTPDEQMGDIQERHEEPTEEPGKVR